MRRTGLARGSDRADSGTIGTMLMIATVVVMAAGMTIWASKGSDGGPPPKAMGLAASRAGGGDVQMTVASVAQGTPWNDLRVTLDGVTGGYGIAVTGSGWTQTAVSEAWNGGALGTTRYASPGDIIRVNVTAAQPAPVTLRIVDGHANAVIVTMPVLGLGG